MEVSLGGSPFASLGPAPEQVNHGRSGYLVERSRKKKRSNHGFDSSKDARVGGPIVHSSRSRVRTTELGKHGGVRWEDDDAEEEMMGCLPTAETMRKSKQLGLETVPTRSGVSC